MQGLQGACLCGSIQWTMDCPSETDAISSSEMVSPISQICVCHCTSCQRQSGSTEVPYCGVARSAFWSSLNKEGPLYKSPFLRGTQSYCSRGRQQPQYPSSSTRNAEDGANLPTCTRYFCGKCATSIAVELHNEEDGALLWIPMGTLKATCLDNSTPTSSVNAQRDFQACLEERAIFSTAIQALQPRSNQLLILTLKIITALRLVALIQMIVLIRQYCQWMVEAVGLLLVQQDSLAARPKLLYSSGDSGVPSKATTEEPLHPFHRRIIPQLHGTCDCGTIQWRVSDVSMPKACICFCTSCQQYSGSSTGGLPFCCLDRQTMANALKLPSSSTCSSSSKLLASFSSSSIATRYFCTQCASPVAFQYNQELDRIWIPMGTLINFDPSILDPTKDNHIFCKERPSYASALLQLPVKSKPKR